MAGLLKGSLRLAFLGCLAGRPAAAQTPPPRVEVQRLGERLPSLPVGGVGVGDCFAPVALREAKEVALVTISVNGAWERSAQHLAKQTAAEAGANCLQPLASYGPEETLYPVVRQYKAFLVTTSVNTPDGSFRIPAAARSFEAASPPATPLFSAFGAPAAAEPAAGEAPEKEAEFILARPHDPARLPWIEGPHIDAHEIVLALSRMTPRNWEDVRGDIKRHFPASEFETLVKARGAGGTVAVDFRKRTIALLSDDF